MWDIEGVASRFKLEIKPPELKPAPPKPEPKIETNDALKADLRQTGAFLRSKLENLFAAPACAPAQTAAPGAERILQIAQNNAPMLVLPRSNSALVRAAEETFLPNASQSNLLADPQTYIENSRLREDVPFNPNPFSFNAGRDKAIGDNTDGDSNNNFTSANVGGVTNERYFLDLNNDKRGKLGSENAPVFYQFQSASNGEPPKLTYHFFYDYNDAPKGLGIDFNHEGDWERLTYELNPTSFEPVKATLSAHEGGATYDFSSLRLDETTNRPLIFVANGSHANYATPGNHDIDFAGVPVTFDQTSDTDDAVIFDAGRNLKEVTSQPWYPATGNGLHWGEVGESEHSTGPQGPSENKGAVK